MDIEKNTITMQLKNEGGGVPLITISLVIGQSVNMILISSCSISDTFESFSIVLKCVYYFCLKEFKKKENGKIISRIKTGL